eukprot:966540_1
MLPAPTLPKQEENRGRNCLSSYGTRFKSIKMLKAPISLVGCSVDCTRTPCSSEKATDTLSERVGISDFTKVGRHLISRDDVSNNMILSTHHIVKIRIDSCD